MARLELTASDTKPSITFWSLEKTSLAPFHRFSPALKTLHVDSMIFPYPQVFDLVCSFPLLEALTLTGDDQSLNYEDDTHGPQTIVPSASPPLTGSLELTSSSGLEMLRADC